MTPTDLIEPLDLTRESTAEQLARALRDRILRGELAPGTPVPELALASSAGVSRNTAREAIKLLVHEGLLRHLTHRGAAVTQLTRRDVVEIFRVRRVLETAGLDAGGRRPEDLEPLRRALADLERAARGRDWQQLVRSDLVFHRRLVELTGSNRLTLLFEAIEGELQLGFSIVAFVDREFEQPEPLVEQHREILRHLAEGRRAKARRLLLDHLARYEQRLIDVLTID